ncbi:hypothetical protein DCAR_0626645 [Daucus carota subsp. sativus]|uniref:Uncharacterized protein n=1 Tax=Daucus carota subsp. sativus TaxID=79200 RepID=A0A161WVW8_DAUCS|nr:PREDICTED: uncharacterized protein LOC108226377 [Daucus carota subsp. sativus]WOH07216.1 hypothetical protein DCAR_0626645 [Daucus carota subsp. sativus]
MVPVADLSPFPALWKAVKKNDQVSDKKVTRVCSDSDKKVLGVCSFEVASLMSRMIQLWNFLNKNVEKSQDFIDSVGIENLLKDNNGISDLVYGEVIYIFCEVARIIVRLAKRCSDARLKNLEHEIEGQLLKMKNSWIILLPCKKMDETIKEMGNLVTDNQNLYALMQELVKLEEKLEGKNSVQRLFQLETKIEETQVKVSHLKRSLWNAYYDDIVLLLSKCLFTIFVRIESLFNVVHVPGDDENMNLVRGQTTEKLPINRLAKLWSSARGNRKTSPLENLARCMVDHSVTRESNGPGNKTLSIFKTRMQSPSSGTLGDAELEKRYANAILEIDTLVMLPILISDAKLRELKKMLPRKISFVVKERLKLVQNETSLSVSIDMISEILNWLTPLAHNTITRWMSEQKYAHQNINTCGEKLLLQVETLCFADKEKADAVVSELLIGLTHINLAQKQLSDYSSEIVHVINDPMNSSSCLRS